MSGGEFALIERWFTRPAKSAVVGVGDDCAVIRVTPGHEIAMSTDMLVEGRHFIAGSDPERLGHKTLAVNLSDCAAAGAKPRYALLSMALPDANPEWLSAFSRGFFALADRYEVELIGGDTTRGPLNLCVTIIGEVPVGQTLLRSGARPGDVVWVSGKLGSAAVGLAMVMAVVRGSESMVDAGRSERIADATTDATAMADVTEARSRAIDALERPEPRVALGIALRGVASSAIDISDGLVGDLGHILERSRVGAEIFVERLPCESWLRTVALGDAAARALPMSRSDALRALLAGGDDYELCFTAAASHDADVIAAGRAAGVDVTPIGRIVEGDALRVIGASGNLLPADDLCAFDHFR